MAKYAKSLPVLMYHSISNYPDKLCIPPALFEEHCRITAENGWRGVSLAEAEEFFLHGAKLPEKSFLITLDDGYLDNYVNAWPILKKHGHKAVVFAVADEIDAASQAEAQARPTLADIWAGRVTQDALPDVDNPVRESGLGYPVRRDLFFNWAEARAMEASGVMAVAAHGLRHEAVFSGPVYEKFLQPGRRVTPFDKTVREMIWGQPWFERHSEFAGAAFLPNPELMQAVRALVPQEEAAAHAFFETESNQARLRELVESFNGRLGEFETEEAQKERLASIFASNQEVFRRELGHAARSFCWPWGKRCALSLEVAAKHGFCVFFNVAPGVNPPGKAVDINRLNAKRDPQKTLNRLRIYSRPLLGAIYQKLRR